MTQTIKGPRLAFCSTIAYSKLRMRFFKYLLWWERIFYIFIFLVVLDIVVGMIASKFNSGLGFGGLILIYSAMQTGMTLRYRSLNRYPSKERDCSWEKQIRDLEGWKKLWSGLSIRASFVLWGFSLLYNFILAPIILKQMGL